MTTVHFVRHGAHDLLGLTLCGRAAGVGINALGMRQAAAVGKKLAAVGVDAVHTSPVGRARQTAETIATACDRPVQTMPALTEIDFGAWTGRSFSELDSLPAWRDWNANRDQARPPDGETMRQVQDRLADWLAALRDATVVAVSHADVVKAAVCLALGLSLRAHDRFQVDPGSITTLLAEGGHLTLRSLNEAPNE